MNVESWGAALFGKNRARLLSVLLAARSPVTESQLCETTGLKLKRVQMLIERLREAGLATVSESRGTSAVRLVRDHPAARSISEILQRLMFTINARPPRTADASVAVAWNDELLVLDVVVVLPDVAGDAVVDRTNVGPRISVNACRRTEFWYALSFGGDLETAIFERGIQIAGAPITRAARVAAAQSDDRYPDQTST
ncbi:MAG: hypothetical protein ACRDT9_06465 [Agromyces sp.]